MYLTVYLITGVFFPWEVKGHKNNKIFSCVPACLCFMEFLLSLIFQGEVPQLMSKAKGTFHLSPHWPHYICDS